MLKLCWDLRSADALKLGANITVYILGLVAKRGGPLLANPLLHSERQKSWILEFVFQCGHSALSCHEQIQANFWGLCLFIVLINLINFRPRRRNGRPDGVMYVAATA